MRSRALRALLAVADVTCTVVGVVGLVTGIGATTTTTTLVSAASPVTSTTAAATATETPAQFLDALGRAFREADTTFLFNRLHPAVIARYGEGTCRTYISTRRDTTARFTVLSTAPPATYAWTTDNQTTSIPSTLSVTVNRMSAGQTARAVVHVTAVGGAYRWFTDCTPG